MMHNAPTQMGFLKLDGIDCLHPYREADFEMIRFCPSPLIVTSECRAGAGIESIPGECGETLDSRRSAPCDCNSISWGPR